MNWLLAAVLLLGVAHSARSDDCSDFPGGVLDGAAGTVPPVQLNIDQDCRVQNYTQANPFDTNVNFDTDPGDPNSQAHLIIFNNVYFTGQMSCNDNHIHNHRLWFVNGTIATNLQPTMPGPFHSGREDRQAEPGRPDRCHDRRAVHLHAHDAGDVGPADRHDHQ